jgi:hypothetical protein
MFYALSVDLRACKPDSPQRHEDTKKRKDCEERVGLFGFGF